MTTRIRDAQPKARKAHICQMCNGPIAPGDTYSRATMIYDGRIYDWVECSACQADSVCHEVHASWGFCEEGVGFAQAEEWAHETVRLGGPAQDMARRWLSRASCECEHCTA